MDNKSEKIVTQIGLLFETIATSSVFFENIEMSFAELRCLLFVIKSKGCTMSDLTNSFGIPPSTATGIIDRLVEDNFVFRSRSKDDRRKVALNPTDKGLKLHKHHREVILKEMRETLDSISNKKKDDLLNSLKFVNNLLSIGSLSKSN
jgi:DNA-binding MarR family transcriptional regulator